MSLVVVAQGSVTCNLWRVLFSLVSRLVWVRLKAGDTFACAKVIMCRARLALNAPPGPQAEVVGAELARRS